MFIPKKRLPPWCWWTSVNENYDNKVSIFQLLISNYSNWYNQRLPPWCRWPYANEMKMKITTIKFYSIQRLPPWYQWPSGMQQVSLNAGSCSKRRSLHIYLVSVKFFLKLFQSFKYIAARGGQTKYILNLLNFLKASGSFFKL